MTLKECCYNRDLKALKCHYCDYSVLCTGKRCSFRVSREFWRHAFDSKVKDLDAAYVD